MRVAIFSTKPYDRDFLNEMNEGHNHDFTFYEPRLTAETRGLAEGFPAVCAFVNDQLPADTIAHLAERGLKLIVLRCAGFNNIDLNACDEHGVTVLRVPAYSPHAVAEHTLGLILTLNRKIHRAHNRTREANFSLDGLLGFDLHGRTVGVIGTGKIGAVFINVMKGLGCHILAYDPYPNESLGVQYVALDELLGQSDVISLHCPLTPETYHLINPDTIAQMKRGVMLINTSRGALIDTQAVLDALKDEQIGYVGLDVYEEESDLFFEDLSDRIVRDDVFMRLMTFPNVIVTGHQAFFTQDALRAIATTTVNNVTAFEKGDINPENQVMAEKVIRSS